MTDLSLFLFAILKCFVTTGLIVSIPLAVYFEFRGRQLATNRVKPRLNRATSLPRKHRKKAA